MNGRFSPQFREGSGSGAAPKTGTDKKQQTAIPGRSLCCHACGQVITSEDARRQVEGAHVHERTNPAGYHFQFGCFDAAPGCACVGEPSGEASWFTACVWRLALCGSCGEHLGWRFSGADEFHGLILDRLIQADE